MQTKQLGNSNLNITPVGYGAWAIGGSGWQFAWGSQNDDDSVAAIHRALELGVNWIDSAAVYGLGHSEEVVARALKGWSGPKPYIFTKCGLRWDKNGHEQKILSGPSVREEVENSLRRLNLDVIDLYQIHWPPDPDSPMLEEAWSTMAEPEARRKSTLDWRLELRCQTDAAGEGDCADHVAAAAVFLSSSRRGRRHSAVLFARGDWRDCVFPDGFRFADGRNDA